MKVEIWSDIGCPWCYIGRRRFEKALAQFPHGGQVEVIWRSFQLDPNAPAEYPGSVNDMLVETRGYDRRDVESMQVQITALAAQEGLEFHLDRVRPANTLDAHRLLHLAARHGLQGQLKERLQKAYFTEGLLVSDHETLLQLAVETGLDAGEVQQVLQSDAFKAEVQADVSQAQMLGIHGVPFFVLAGKYGISGAQKTELFISALDRVWAETQPLVTLTGDERDADVCGDEGCAV